MDSPVQYVQPHTWICLHVWKGLYVTEKSMATFLICIVKEIQTVPLHWHTTGSAYLMEYLLITVIKLHITDLRSTANMCVDDVLN